jgi:hypothetical protein
MWSRTQILFLRLLLRRKEEDKVNKMAAMSTCGHALRNFFYAFCWRSSDPPKEEDKVNKMAAMSACMW